jgi:four helix bundle protein
MDQKPEDIRERVYRFALQVINLSEQLPPSRSGNILAKQLIRSGTSIGANAQEALAAQSRADFVYKNNIALREARETHYWLRLIKGSNLVSSTNLDTLYEEADQIMRIFGAIVTKARGKSKKRD